MTRTFKRATTVALSFLLVLNLTNFLMPTLVRAAREAEVGIVSVSPPQATAGALLSIDGAGFAAGEALTIESVTPGRQALGLGLLDDGQTLVVGEGAAVTADETGAISLALATGANYQEGTWSLVLRGQESGRESWGQFTLAAPTPTPLALQATPAASAAPAATAAPQPTTVPAAAPSAAPSVAPSTAPTAVPAAAPAATTTAPAATAAAPLPSASSAPPSPAPSAAPSAAPATSATPAASAAPSAAPASAVPSTPSPSAPAAPSAAPSTAPSTLPAGTRAVVSSPTGNASVRATPSTGAASVTVLNNGALVTISGAGQEAEGLAWVPVTGDGFSGWVVASLLVVSVAPPAATPTPGASPSPSPAPAPTAIGPGTQVIVNAPGGGANLRQEPSASAAVIQVVPNGTALAVTGASQTADGYVWWPVRGNGAPGWIAADLIELAPNASPSASASPSPGASPSPSATPTDHGPGVPPPIDGPALAPSQLLPVFQKASQLVGIPTEVLLAIGRVESGFDPRAIGPFLPQFAGTENEHALGMMQFLPGTYRGVMERVDAATGKNLGINGIWDAESAIYAAAFYLHDSGAGTDIRRALFAYNNADWYVDLILAWANQYAGGTVADPNIFDPSRNGAPPISLAVPQNPLLPSNTRHIDMLSPIQLYAPWTAGQTWHAGAEGSFYGSGYHVDSGGSYYTVDFNKGVYPNVQEDDGELILAAADGIVNNIYQDGAGAWVVELYHIAPDGSQLRTQYVHLKMDPRINPGIRTNQVVYHGTPIGINGATGNATGPHLHFGLWLLKDSQWVSIRPEPMEGQYLSSGANITSTNQIVANTATPRTIEQGFAPQSPSNADRVTIAAATKGGATPLDRIEVYVNTAGDGSDRGTWQAVGTIKGASGQVAWQTAPIADGSYRVLFVMIDPDGNRTYQGLTNETAVRYIIRRGDPRGSAVVNPRVDLALLAPLDGATIASIGAQGPVVSGPLRYLPADGQSGRLEAIGRGAAIAGQTAQVGSGPTGKVRDGNGIFIEEATTNLVTNPSFERNTDGWTIRNLPGGALVATTVASGPFGKQSVRLDNRAGTADAAFVTVAGDGNTATWSVYARAASEGATFGLQMSGLEAQQHALLADWQRFTLTGTTGGAGNERLIVVPAGMAIEIDAAQLELKPYATTYADGSLGLGYGWDRQADNSFSGRLPTGMQVNLDGVVSAERGALAFWATPLSPAAEGAQLLALGDTLTLALGNNALTLRWGDQAIGAMPWVVGETHHYAVAWDNGTLAFFQDGQLVVETFLPNLALPGERVAQIGTDRTGTKAANVVIQDLAAWGRLPSRTTLAAMAQTGDFLRAGVPQAQTFDVTVALASQGLAPTGLQMQFSFDGQTWTAPEPFTATKTILLPDASGSVQVYVRFIDPEGRTIVIVDRVQVIAKPNVTEDDPR